MSVLRLEHGRFDSCTALFDHKNVTQFYLASSDHGCNWKVKLKIVLRHGTTAVYHFLVAWVKCFEQILQPSGCDNHKGVTI